MIPKQLPAWIAILGWAMTACSAGGGASGASPASTAVGSSATAAHSSVGGGPSGTPDAVPSGPGQSPDALLAQQIAIVAAGDSAAPSCTADPSRLPGLGTPAVWVGNIAGKQRVTFPEESALCLSGFSSDQPVQITVNTGSRQYTSSASPTPTPLTFTHEEPPDSLFGGGSIAAHEASNSVLQTEKWWFIPPTPAREDLATSGRLSIQASQGSLTAAYTQPVALPSDPDRIWVPNGGHDLFIFGFAPGTHLPVGLYKEDQPDAHAVLVQQIGQVTMPPSRTVVFTVPGAVLAEAGQGTFCVTVPLATQYNCPKL